MQGDVSLSAEDVPPTAAPHKFPYPDQSTPGAVSTGPDLDPDEEFEDEFEEDEEEDDRHSWLDGNTAVKFLSAGGIAGAGSSQLI